MTLAIEPFTERIPVVDARKVIECRHRVSLSDGSFGCRQIQLCSAAESIDECRVQAVACEVCCTLRIPTDDHPNSVVASLAHSLLSERLRTISDAKRAVDAGERLLWIEQFLERHDHSSDQKLPAVGRLAAPMRAINRLLSGRIFRRKNRIGIAGFNNLKGLGHLNRDLVHNLGIEDWLLSSVSEEGCRWARQLTSRVYWLETSDAPGLVIDRFLSNIEFLLFAETPPVPSLPEQARRQGVRVICIPMWERIHPGLEWVKHVDVMLCPTEWTRQMLLRWKACFHFSWAVVHCRWPIDVGSFAMKLRRTCRRYLFINGTDLGFPCDRSGTATRVRRKGLETLLAAAAELPHIPFLIWSQVEDLPSRPANVEVRMLAAHNEDLYHDGDVCVQLSRWEGLGLPLLECQASGMPLITLDAPPMNEHSPMDLVRVSSEEVLELWSRRWINAPLADQCDVVRVLGSWFERDISQHSENARRTIEQRHSWQAFSAAFREWIDNLRNSQIENL